jgi:hypothetical protein
MTSPVRGAFGALVKLGGWQSAAQGGALTRILNRPEQNHRPEHKDCNKRGSKSTQSAKKEEICAFWSSSLIKI